MLRLYVLACSGLAAVSLLVWGMIATYSIRLLAAPARPDESVWGVVLVLAIVCLYPALVVLFGLRSWRFWRTGDYASAAGPATLIGLSALALIGHLMRGSVGS